MKRKGVKNSNRIVRCNQVEEKGLPKNHTHLTRMKLIQPLTYKSMGKLTEFDDNDTIIHPFSIKLRSKIVYMCKYTRHYYLFKEGSVMIPFGKNQRKSISCCCRINLYRENA